MYNWDFGDGFTSTDPYPSHTYAVAGTYTVTMTATNPLLPCSSRAQPVVIIVRNFNSAFSFSSSYVAGSCPPLLVSFVNTSYNYISVDWDFGDGITAGNVNYASHIYEKPGKYIVTLNVHGYNGIEGQFIDSIIIREPVVTLSPASAGELYRRYGDFILDGSKYQLLFVGFRRWQHRPFQHRNGSTPIPDRRDLHGHLADAEQRRLHYRHDPSVARQHQARSRHNPYPSKPRHTL